MYHLPGSWRVVYTVILPESQTTNVGHSLKRIRSQWTVTSDSYSLLSIQSPGSFTLVMANSKMMNHMKTRTVQNYDANDKHKQWRSWWYKYRGMTWDHTFTVTLCYTHNNINNQQDQQQQHQQQHQHHGSNININQIHSIFSHSTGNNTSFLAQLKLADLCRFWCRWNLHSWKSGLVAWNVGVQVLAFFCLFQESISWLLVVNAAMILDSEGWRGSMLYNCTCGFETKHQENVTCCFLLCFR